MEDSTKCLFCTEIIFPYTVRHHARWKANDGKSIVPTFSKLCDCLQFKREESRVTLNGRKLLFEKLGCYYESEEGKVSGATGCNTFFCLSCFERVDHLVKLHEQLTEIQGKIRESTKGLELMLERQHGRKRENDKDFEDVLQTFWNFVKGQGISGVGSPNEDTKFTSSSKKRNNKNVLISGDLSKKRKFEETLICEHIIVKPELNEAVDNDDFDNEYFHNSMVFFDPLAEERSTEEGLSESERDVKVLEFNEDSLGLQHETHATLWDTESKFPVREVHQLHGNQTGVDNALNKSTRQKIKSAKSKRTMDPKVFIPIDESSSDNLVCPHCPHRSWMRFKSKVSLRNHIKMKHTSDQDKNIRCDECGCGFMSHTALRRHMMRDHQETRLLCTYCPKSFLTPHFLKEHLELHALSGGGPAVVKCSMCDKEFSSKYCLKTHIQSQHEVTDPVECDDCGKTMKNIWALRAHRSTACSKEISCDQCSLVFKNDSLLTKHKRMVHFSSVKVRGMLA